jgi:hypothetical protein
MHDDPWSGRAIPVGVWGDVETSHGRYGRQRLRVRILPPAVTPGEADLLRSARVWGALGLPVGAIAALASQTVLPAWSAVIVGAFVWLLPLGIAHARTRAVTRDTREVWACHDESGADERCDAGYDDLCKRLEVLYEAERAARDDPDGADALRAAWRELYAFAGEEERRRERSTLPA